MSVDLATILANKPQWILGLMSGTSLDGVDAAMICTDGETVTKSGAFVTIPYSSRHKQILAAATRAAQAWNFSGPEPDCFKAAGRVLLETHGEAIAALQQTGITPALIGFHGQTVLHKRPIKGQAGASKQLGDGQALADMLGLPVVYDFRSADIAAGGEGAPLAPSYHRALLRRCGLADGSAVLNIGGVANLTWESGSELIAFDTGPGNGPIDEWVELHDHGSHDPDGKFAASGKMDETAIGKWLTDPYFALPAPKSLDRSDFPASLAQGMGFADGAASLTALAVQAIMLGLETLPRFPAHIIATGGGVHNKTLMQMLKSRLGARLLDAAKLGIRSDAVEAEAFAFLAARSARGLALSWPGTTGVKKPLSGGKLAFPA